MSNANLGRLEQVDLRTIWTHEEKDFTPWLALPENLAVLGKTLGVELELEAREKSVGRYSADILCKEVGSDRWVLIENQLEKTDHSHLGQLLTYSAGLQAVTIVWIAANFTDEHRAALDWLNQSTIDKVRFFGLEVELWRIGTSPAAPKFNIIAKPNDWSRSVAQAARAIEDGQLSETQASQVKYWAALNSVLEAKKGPVRGNRKPLPQSWATFPIGRSGFGLNAASVRAKGMIRAEIYISGTKAKAFFGLMFQQREKIEQKLGFKLEWEELPAGTDSRIACYLPDVDVMNEADWPKQHGWFADKLNTMHQVFGPIIRELNADMWAPAG